MTGGTRKHHLNISTQRFGQSLRWLAIALLLFSQVSLASHVHDIGDLNSHDCTVCSQLQTVKHGSSSASFSLIEHRGEVLSFISAQPSLPNKQLVRPPTRAPPRH